MKITKMMLILGCLIFITGCSSININETDDLDTVIPTTGDEEMVEVVEGTTDFGELEVDEVLEIDTTTVTTEEKLTLEDEALTETVKTLIDERKDNSDPDEGLTEEDIELMENILQEIVDGA